MADSNTTMLDLLKMDTGSHDNDWGDQTNLTLDAIEAAVKGARVTNTTGGVTTLSKTTAREFLQRVTGTLASNATIEVPNISSRWLFSNETTGAFTVTVKVNGQTGVVVPQGSSITLRGNGTDVVAVNAAQPRGQDEKATAVGGTVDAITLTLPFSPSKPTPGMKVTWTSAGANTITNPTVTINGTALTIKKGQSVALAVGDTGVSGYPCEGIVADNGTDLLLKNPATNLFPTSFAQVWSAQQSFDGGIGIAGGPVILPGGILTVESGVPVSGSDQSARTTIYYTPYLHNGIMLYDGTRWVQKFFTELSQALSDSSKSPAAASANNLYDLFVWNDAGTLRCTRGPAWANSGARGTGAGTTELERLHGSLVNKFAITNGPGAQRGVYVGTIATDGSNQMNRILTPAPAAGGTGNRIDVWNMYNRVDVAAMVRDSTNTWDYESTTWRAVNGSNANRITFVRGLNEDPIDADYAAIVTSSATRTAYVAIGINSTTTPSGRTGAFNFNNNDYTPIAARYAGNPGLGLNYAQALERGSGSTTLRWIGDNNDPSNVQTGIIFRARM